MNKLVSIIIPALNEESLIEKTLVSLKKQTYQPIEIIVAVDSRSKDKTIQIARKYTDKVLQVPVKGASATRNFGARVAQGEYLMFLDADTKVSKDLIGNGVEFLNSGYVGGFARVVYETKNPKVKLVEAIQNFFLSQGTPFYIQSFYTTKEFFQRSGEWNEKISLGEEVDILRRISKFGRLKYDSASSIRTSPRRFIKSKDFSYAVLGAALAYAGLKNLPYPPVREVK